MTTFDNTSVFLPEANKARDILHESYGHLGSNLLSIRTDLKTLAGAATPASLSMSMAQGDQHAQERYVVRFRNHQLTITLQSHKATSRSVKTIRQPDTARKLQSLLNSLAIHVNTSYGEALSKFVLAVFNRNASCTFTADHDDDCWNLFFFDAKNRSTVEIDLSVADEFIPSPLLTKDVATEKAVRKARKKQVPVLA